MPQDYVQLLIKYKNQVTALICIIIASACFIGGRMSVHVPPKEVVCKTYIQTKDTALLQLKQERDERVSALQAQRDADRKQCDKDIEAEVEKHKSERSIVDCETAKALYGQCKRRGLIK